MNVLDDGPSLEYVQSHPVPEVIGVNMTTGSETSSKVKK